MQAHTRVRAQVLLAESHLSDDGNLAAAEEALVLAVSLEPHHPKAAYWMGRLRETQGRPDEATSHYEVALAFGAPAADVLERLVALAMGKTAQVSANGDPKTVHAYHARTVELFGKLREAAGDKPAYLLGEARTREAMGDFKGAEAVLQQLVALQPDGGGPHATLAEFYTRHGDKLRAQQERTLAGEAAAPKTRKLRPLRPSR
jgi:Tfp pilus assembly protein PilF